MEKENVFAKCINVLWRGLREFLRKLMVSIKRKPHYIPLLVMTVAYVYYSLNLGTVSWTTLHINLDNMGLAEFVSMLVGLLLLVCFGNAFPHRKKVNILMLCLMLVFVGVAVYCDTFYYSVVVHSDKASEDYALKMLSILNVHRILLGAGVLLTALLPVYTPLLRKINTNIRVEDNGSIGAIDISGEDA